MAAGAAADEPPPVDPGAQSTDSSNPTPPAADASAEPVGSGNPAPASTDAGGGTEQVDIDALLKQASFEDPATATTGAVPPQSAGSAGDAGS